MESKYENIARPWLSAVGSTLSTLTCNKDLYDKINTKLNRVSEDELNHKLEPLNQMMHVPLPTIPEHRNLIDPADISQVMHQSLNELKSLSVHRSNLNSELGEGGRNFAEKVAAARADADQVLWELRKNAEGALRITHGMEILLNLASRSESIIGPRTQGFCNSLRIEAERRAGYPVEELLKRSVPRSFWQADAQELIDSHRSSEYVRLRSVLQTKLGDVKICGEKLKASLEKMKKQPYHIRDKYLFRFRGFILWTLLPFANLIVSYHQAHDVHMLQKALESTEEAYIDLGKRGRRSIWMRLFVSALLMLGWGSAALLGKMFPIDRNWRLVLGLMSLIYLLNALCVAWVLVRWNSFMKSGDRLAH